MKEVHRPGSGTSLCAHNSAYHICGNVGGGQKWTPSASVCSNINGGKGELSYTPTKFSYTPTIAVAVNIKVQTEWDAMDQAAAGGTQWAVVVLVEASCQDLAEDGYYMGNRH